MDDGTEQGDASGNQAAPDPLGIGGAASTIGEAISGFSDQFGAALPWVLGGVVVLVLIAVLKR